MTHGILVRPTGDTLLLPFIESGALAKAAQELESMKKSKGPFS